MIWGQRYDDDGNRVGDNFNVSVFDESQIDPAVSRADDFVVVWQNTNGNDIWGQRFDAQGDLVVARFDFESGSAQATARCRFDDRVHFRGEHSMRCDRSCICPRRINHPAGCPTRRTAAGPSGTRRM